MTKETYICDKCKQRLPVWDDSHHFVCKGQKIVKCPKGHDVGELVVRADGCQKCQYDIYLEEAKKFYCPICGEQGTSRPEGADEDYDEFRCEKDDTHYRVYNKLHDNPDETGEEPRECYDPDYAAEQYEKMIKSKSQYYSNLKN